MLRAILCRMALIGLILAPAAGCGGRPAQRARRSEAERLPRLETVRPEWVDKLEVRRTYAATIEAFEKADLCAQVRGVVAAMPATTDIGRTVRAGEKLLTLDIPDLIADRANKQALLDQAKNQEALAAQAIKVAAAEEKEAQALLTRYEAEAEFRRQQAARVQKLVQTDTVTQQLAEEAVLQHQAAQAALAAAKAQIVTKQARLQAAQDELKVAGSRIQVAQAEYDRLDATVNFAVVRAPFSGVITKRWVDSGATVKDPGMPLVTVMRTDKVRVLIDVPERDVPYIVMPGGGAAGNRVELDIPALRDALGAHRFQGTVTATAGALDPVTRTMRTEVHLEHDQDAKVAHLRPQMTGAATVALAQRKALLVPASALVRSGNKVELYYLAEPAGDPPRGVVKNLEVQLGLDDGKRVEIRGGNLTGRELIIVRGAGMIRAGEQAVPVSGPEKNGGS